MKHPDPVISSAQNEGVKHVRKLLSSPAYRRACALIVVEGVTFIKHMLARPQAPEIDVIYVSESRAGDHGLSDVFDTAKVTVLKDHLMERISDVKSSQGLLAIFKQPPLPSVSAGLPAGTYLLLDSISDPGNAGTLCRSAAGAGAAGVILYGSTVDICHPKVMRAAAGTWGQVPFYAADERSMAELIKSGFTLMTLSAAGAADLFEESYPGNLVVAVGHEARGISSSLAALSGKTLRIPLAEGCESLNAAVAGSLAIFNVLKQ